MTSPKKKSSKAKRRASKKSSLTSHGGRGKNDADKIEMNRQAIELITNMLQSVRGDQITLEAKGHLIAIHKLLRGIQIRLFGDKHRHHRPHRHHTKEGGSRDRKICCSPDMGTPQPQPPPDQATAKESLPDMQSPSKHGEQPTGKLGGGNNNMDAPKENMPPLESKAVGPPKDMPPQPDVVR